METGRLTLERQNSNIVTLIQDIVGQMQATTNDQIIAIDGLSTLTLWIDPFRLERVKVNFLENAIIYSPDGGSIEVNVLIPAPQTAQLIVQDRGIGIPSERREHVFNRFYQAHDEGHFGGMGLGLCVSKQIIELHGGHLYAEFPDEGAHDS